VGAGERPDQGMPDVLRRFLSGDWEKVNGEWQSELLHATNLLKLFRFRRSQQQAPGCGIWMEGQG